MPDELDDLVSTVWESVASGVSEALTNDQISHYVPTALLGDSRLVRANFVWEHANEVPYQSQNFTTVLNHVLVRSVAGANELAVSMVLTADDLKDECNLVQAARNLGGEARRQELLSVVRMISQRAMRQQLCYSRSGLRKALRVLHCQGRQFRLIGAGPTAEYARGSLVEDVVAPMGVLPPPLQGLLLAMVDGPVFQRIEQDLSLTWRRLTTESIRLCISERFFLVGGSEAVTFR